MDVIWLNLGQVELLWSEDRAWSGNTDPADESLGGDLIMLHSPETDQGTRSSEASLAMDGNSFMVWLGEMILDNIEEVINDPLRRS